MNGMRVEVVPDDDVHADPRIPADVLKALGPTDMLVHPRGTMMYIRWSNWQKIKNFFPIQRC